MKKSYLKFYTILISLCIMTQACQGAQGPERQTIQRNRSSSTSSTGSTTSESSASSVDVEQNPNNSYLLFTINVRSINREQYQNPDAFEQAVRARITKQKGVRLNKDDITCNLTCCLVMFGFATGVAIQKMYKPE
jgi:hypothetical protein